MITVNGLWLSGFAVSLLVLILFVRGSTSVLRFIMGRRWF